jgi:hypothetical protein
MSNPKLNKPHPEFNEDLMRGRAKDLKYFMSHPTTREYNRQILDGERAFLLSKGCPKAQTGWVWVGRLGAAQAAIYQWGETNWVTSFTTRRCLIMPPEVQQQMLTHLDKHPDANQWLLNWLEGGEGVILL